MNCLIKQGWKWRTFKTWDHRGVVHRSNPRASRWKIIAVVLHLVLHTDNPFIDDLPRVVCGTLKGELDREVVTLPTLEDEVPP